MTLTLSLSPDIEARLREFSSASGKDVTTLVREAIEEKFKDQAATPEDATTLPFDQWIVKFDEWVGSHQPMQHFIDDSRESIYEGRDE